MMKLLTDLCLECTLARTVQTFGSLVIHIGTSETEYNDLAPVVANQMQFETLEFHESVVGYGIGEIGLQILPDEEQVVVFEIAERTKLEHYQNRHNLTIGEGCLAIATRLTIRGHKRLFVYLLIKFFAKFIHGTENFCNFVIGNHESILLFNFISDWNSDIKVQKISQITNFLCNFLIPNWGNL